MRQLLTLLCLVFLFTLVDATPQQGSRKASPFDGLRWSQGAPEVLVEETWYRPLAIHGTDVEEILKFCESRWPGKREKRFGEDLVEAMEAMNATPPSKVTLLLARLDTGQEVTLENVEMSAAKRQAIRGASRATPPPPSPAPLLSRAAAVADIAEFRARLEDQFAYLNLKGIDLPAELKRVTEQLAAEIPNDQLADQLHRILMRFGDGHASVLSPHAPHPTRFPAVLLGEAEGGVVAFAGDRSAFLDPQRPFLVAIDGHAIEDWIKWLSPWVADGSPQVVRARTLRNLRGLELWRERLGHPASDTVTYRVASRPHARQGQDVTLKLATRRPYYGSWPSTPTRRLEGDIGYLRLDQMDAKLIPDLRRSMSEFKNTKGLIVDVRGNGGGGRGLLIALAGYLVGPAEGPWVGNVAAYRKSGRFGQGHLEARFMYRADDSRWTEEQRSVVASVAEKFEPEWAPGPGFSNWHYLVLDRTEHADEYFYEHPVVILSDSGCFSATDIFLGALRGRPRVTLMGTASGGGSARSQSFQLPNSGIKVRCASMASFRVDGRLYDGRGVEVDVEVQAKAADLLRSGEDHVLETAVEFLGRR